MYNKKEKKTNIPNALTTLRLLLTIPLVILILQEKYSIAIIVFILGVLSDADGTVARKLNQATKFGEKYDIFADTIFAVAAFITLLMVGKLSFLFITILFIANIPRMIFIYLFQKKKETFHSNFLTKLSGILSLLIIPSALLFESSVTNYYIVAIALFTFIVTLPYIIIYTKVTSQPKKSS